MLHKHNLIENQILIQCHRKHETEVCLIYGTCYLSNVCRRFYCNKMQKQASHGNQSTYQLISWMKFARILVLRLLILLLCVCIFAYALTTIHMRTLHAYCEGDDFLVRSKSKQSFAGFRQKSLFCKNRTVGGIYVALKHIISILIKFSEI